MPMGKTSSVSGKGKKAVSADDFELTLYKHIVESAPIPIWIKDTNNRIIKFSKAAGKLHGKKAGRIAGMSLDSMLPKKLADQSRKEDREIIRTKKPLSDIRYTYPLDGGKKSLIIGVKKVPLLDRKGNVTHIIVYGNDITEQQEYEEKMKRNEARNKALLNAIPDLLFITDKNGIFIDFKD